MSNTFVTPYTHRDSAGDISANKHGGNAESEQAHAKAKPTMAQCRRACLLSIHFESGTAKEVAKRLRKPLNTVSGRFSELKQKGLIEPTGQRREGSMELRTTLKGAAFLAGEVDND